MKVIEFLGMPRSGKTTQIELLKKHFDETGTKAIVFADRERTNIIKTDPTDGFSFTLLYFALVVNAHDQYKNTHDVLLVDRGFYDSQMWPELRFVMGEISETEKTQLQNLFQRYLHLVNEAIFFSVSIEEGIRRHKESGIQEAADDVVMNHDWLTSMERSYDVVLNAYPQIKKVNGAGDIQSTHAEVLSVLSA